MKELRHLSHHRRNAGFPGLALLVLLAGVEAQAQSGELADLHTPSNAPAAELFGEKCGMCHREAGMGTGILARRQPVGKDLLENREDLQADFVKTVVRQGFNTMFPLGRAEVSDDELERIASYLSTREGDTP